MTAPIALQTLAARELFSRYDALLLDAYGVLVNAHGVLPHAVNFIEALRARNMPFFIVTNDASRLPETIAARFAGLGLNIAADQIVTSAGLLPDCFNQQGLQGCKTVVVGSDDAMTYVQRAGGVAVRPAACVEADARAVVICDATGSQTVADVEHVIDLVVHRRERGEPIDLILCNPDLIYPKSPGHFGLTSGALMLLVEASLKTKLHPSAMPPIHRLGKPFDNIFAEAVRRAGTRKVGLIGDQLGTDILGANTFGIDSLLVGTGLTQVTPGQALDPMPSFYVPNLALS